MKKCVLTSAIAGVLAIAVALPVVAGRIEPKYATYLETLGENECASAIVFLMDRPNARAIDDVLRSQGASLSVRHEHVITALRNATERSQPALLNYLDERIEAGTVEGYTPYWITNMVVVSATKGELQRIAQRADVEAIEPNFRVTLIEEVDQPYTPQKAGIGVTLSLQAINADRVWNELGYTGAGRLAANLDTGVDGDHPALTDRWRGNWHPWYECWRDALGTGTQYPVDNHGHGTHTMGTICGAGHGTGDTVGVAFEALWIADNSIDQGVGPGFDNDVLGAFQWFADPDGDPGTTDDVPDVVQNSWGIDSRFGYDYQDCDYRWQEAIENCEAAGVVVTFSAGNEGPGAQTHRSPANICNTPTVNFSVGAVDCENYGWPYPIASWSSRGPSDCDGVTIKPEVVAPGVSVYSSYPGGGYARMSGTSMAGPHVAGVVVLMRQANPNADVQTIKEILMSTTHDLGSTGEDNTYGWGFIDAYEAVLAVSEPDNIPPEVTVTDPNGGEVLDVGSIFTITWDATDNVGVTSTSVYYSYDGGATYNFIESFSGNPGYYDWTVPNTPSTNCLVKVYAYDAASNEGWDVSDGYFTIQGDVVPPEVTVTDPNGGEVLDIGSIFTITWDATDNVGVTSTSVYYSYDGGATYNFIQNFSGNPGYYNWTVPDTPSNSCLVKVYAYDAAANEGWDVSDGYFTIQGDVVPPEVTVTAPNGGEVLNIGSVYTITWNATDNVGVTSTSVYYSYDGGANYNFIQSFSGNPGYYDWTVPDTPSNSCLVKVYAYDAENNEGSDVSDGYFTIQEAVAEYVWVKTIDLSIQSLWILKRAWADVLVLDQDNNPVASAQVYSHWGGLTTDSDIFYTGSNGWGTCSSNWRFWPRGYWYYYVDDVVVPGYEFRSDLGETFDSIYVQ